MTKEELEKYLNTENESVIDQIRLGAKIPVDEYKFKILGLNHGEFLFYGNEKYYGKYFFKIDEENKISLMEDELKWDNIYANEKENIKSVLFETYSEEEWDVLQSTVFKVSLKAKEHLPAQYKTFKCTFNNNEWTVTDMAN